MFAGVKAFSCARMYISVRSTRCIRPESSRETDCVVLVGLGGQCTLQRCEHAHTKRLEHMRRMRWEGKQVDCVLHAMRNHMRRNMASMAVYNKKAVESWVGWPTRGLENGSRPLVCVAIGCPAANAR